VGISGTGLANALIGGVPPGGPPVEVTITATLGSVSGSTTLIATDNLTSIAVSPSSITLNVDAQQTFTATGSYQDGTTSGHHGTGCVEQFEYERTDDRRQRRWCWHSYGRGCRSSYRDSR
jgi:hypothetical protein